MQVSITAKTQFQVAWIFLLVTAFSGMALRLFAFVEMPGIAYTHLLHAHSHVAFLGWVFNAFFALAVWVWIAPDRGTTAHRIFWILQLANVGMFVSFLAQGYGAVSIAFSTLHMGVAVVFVILLWRAPRVAAKTRPWLRGALFCFLLSSLGPLLLGPLAVLDLRDSPLYSLSIYWYLHFQYNGWFTLFLIALAIEAIHRQGNPWRPHRAGFGIFASGIGLTFLISVLWLDPPHWVYGLAALGAVLQLIALAMVFSPWRHLLAVFAALRGFLPRLLVVVATSALLSKCLLQLLACLPQLDVLVNHRFMVIAFLHGVFLGVVLPAIIAAAIHLRWLLDTPRTRIALTLFAIGFLGGQYGLVHAALNLGSFPLLAEFLLLAAILKASGLAAISWRTIPKIQQI